jgi:hypothetical protein
VGTRRTEYKEGDRVVYDYDRPSCRYLHGSLGYILTGPSTNRDGDIRYRIIWDIGSPVHNSPTIRNLNFTTATFSLVNPILEYDPKQQGDRDDDI